MSRQLPDLNALANLDVNKKVEKIDPMSIPGFIPAKDPKVGRYSIRYVKIDVDDPLSLSEPERIETRAIRDEGVYIISNERFLFMDKILLLVKYMEEEVRSSNPTPASRGTA